MATSVSDLGRVAELRFVLGFALLWSDQIEESETWLEKALTDARRIGDAMLENRAAAYLATCIRRLGRVEAAVEASRTALTTAQALEDRHYEGHALANLCWGSWMEGSLVEAKGLGLGAFEAWGPKEGDGMTGLDTEFAFLAVWPMASMALQADKVSEAGSYLRYLLPPWERAMPLDLHAAVDSLVRETPSRAAVQDALRIARGHRLA